MTKIMLKQLQFVIFAVLIKNYIDVKCCETSSFSRTELTVRYSFGNTRTIHVSGCASPYATVVENSSVVGSVIFLSCIDQSVPVLHEHAVVNFSQVKEIQFRRNQMAMIESEAFANLFSLEMLTISENEFEYLNEKILLNVPNLEALFLNNNRLLYFEQDWLGSLPQLKYLNFGNNSVQSISEFSNFKSLAFLIGDRNSIFHIPGRAFDGLNKLIVVDLSYNKVSQLHDSVFMSTRNLQVLNLYNNNIKYITPEVLKDLTRLDKLILLYNPIPCECYDNIKAVLPEESTQVGRFSERNIFTCTKAKDIADLPVCVDTEAVCTLWATEDLYHFLHSKVSDHECHTVYSSMYPVK